MGEPKLLGNGKLTVAARISSVFGAAAWRSLSVGIEANRRGLKVAVGAASASGTPTEKFTALKEININAGWPQP